MLNVIWGPRMTIMPHNHLMWAVIGIYTGREANIFRRRLTDEPGGRVEAAGAKSLGERDAEPLGRDIIHSVTNPLSRLTGAIHVYGGDFFAVSRSDWDPETLLERTYDMEKNLRLFEDANQANANQNLSLVSAYPELPICQQGIRRTGVTMLVTMSSSPIRRTTPPTRPILITSPDQMAAARLDHDRCHRPGGQVDRNTCNAGQKRRPADRRKELSSLDTASPRQYRFSFYRD